MCAHSSLSTCEEGYLNLFHVFQKVFCTPDGSCLNFLKDSTLLQAGRSNPSGLKYVSASIVSYMSDYFAPTTTCLSVEPGESEECNARRFFQHPLSLISFEIRLPDEIACLSATLCCAGLISQHVSSLPHIST